MSDEHKMKKLPVIINPTSLKITKVFKKLILIESIVHFKMVSVKQNNK